MDAVRSKRLRSIAVTEESPDVTAQVRKRVARASVLHVHAEEPAEQSNPRQGMPASFLWMGGWVDEQLT